ncbi:MAG: LysR family transcriptional regulator [Polyangiales bacterium]
MATIDLNLVRALVAVHESGSFSGAATRLGVPRSTVSRAVSALEDTLGVLLFQRTTRQVVTTPAGVALVDRVRPSLTGLERALADVPEADEEPTGTLRITTTADLGATFLADVVTRFVARYPQVDVQVHLNTSLVDLVAGGFDLALRIANGPQRDSSLVVRKVGAVKFQLFAAASYLARRGAPRNADDLNAHELVWLPGAPWPFRERGRKRTPTVTPRVQADEMFFMRALIRAGSGIGGLPSFLAADDLTAGTLVRVLPRYSFETGTVYFAHPARKHVPRRVTVFQELALEMLRRGPLAG